MSMINFIGMNKDIIESEISKMGFQFKGVIFENSHNICLEYRSSPVVRTLEISFARRFDGLFCTLLRLY